MALGMNDFRSIVIKADAANTSIAPIRLSQNDQDGRRIVFELWDGAESISATGLTARLLFGVGEGGYATMTAVTGAATATWAVDVPQEALQTAGVVRMAVEVASGSQAVCTRIFDAVVEPALIDESSPEAQDALSEFRAAVARLEDFTVPVVASKGGTGRTTLTSNAVLAGNGTGQVKQIATAAGALFATAANGAASFGTLPVAQGGTGATTANDACGNLGAVKKSGDTMTGSLTETGVNLYVDTPTLDPTDPTATTYQSGFGVVMRDKDSKNAAVVRAIRNTARSTGLNIFGQREVNGSSVTNQLSLLVREDGTRAIDVSDDKLWASIVGAQSIMMSTSGQEAQMTFKSNLALIFAKRAGAVYVGIVDYWAANATTIFSSGEAPTITKPQNSHVVTVKNNISSAASAIVVTMISVNSTTIS